LPIDPETTWKECRVPTEQPFRCERSVEVARRIEHHLDDTFDFSPGLGEAGYIEPQFASDRRTDLFGVEVLPLDSRGLYDLVGERSQARLGSELEPQGLHPAEVSALLVAHGCQGPGQGLVVPGKLRPSRPFMDVRHIHRFLCGDYTPYSPHRQAFAAASTANRPVITVSFVKTPSA
jgi:hypothetical protein